MKSSDFSISPEVAIWLGTFIAAGSQIVVNAQDEQDDKKRHRLYYSGIRIGIFGPILGFSIWKGSQKILPYYSSYIQIIFASLLGTSLLQNESEFDSVNNVIWLRVLSGLYSKFTRMQIDLVCFASICITFHGVIHNRILAPKALVNMIQLFISKPKYQEIQTSTKSTLELQDGVDIFVRTFKKLFTYNVLLHVAAALVGYFVRKLGAKTIKGASGILDDLYQVLFRALKEALQLNCAVSTSCALLYLGSKLHWFMGCILVPFPLLFLPPRVRDTLYFLYVPWATKYVYRLFQNEIVNVRMRILFATLILEKPLKEFQQHEGYSWMVGVAFNIVQKFASTKYLS